ncbi:MAG: 2-oxo acid dehydrogenase subunit E2 [Devosia sp.]
MTIPAFKSVRYSKMRRILELTLRTAARIPVIHGLVEVDVTLPRTLLAAHRERAGESLSFTAFIVHCLAASVADFPAVHALRAGSHALRVYDDIDVAVLVERDLDGAKQPIIPIVRAANRLSLLEIHAFIREAQTQPVEKAWRTIPAFAWIPYWVFWLGWPLFWHRVRRDPELHRKYRGTIGVSAVGMFGKGGGWGIPVADNTSLTVGGIATRPAYVDGVLVPREFLSLTLSFDHATIDGAVAARFANRLRELIEAGHGLPGA